MAVNEIKYSRMPNDCAINDVNNLYKWLQRHIIETLEIKTCRYPHPDTRTVNGQQKFLYPLIFESHFHFRSSLKRGWHFAENMLLGRNYVARQRAWRASSERNPGEKEVRSPEKVVAGDNKSTTAPLFSVWLTLNCWCVMCLITKPAQSPMALRVAW